MVPRHIKVRSQQREQRDHAMRLAGCFGLWAGHADTATFPIYVAPRQRERFAWSSQPSESSHRYEQLPPHVWAMFDHAIHVVDGDVGAPLRWVTLPLPNVLPRIRRQMPEPYRIFQHLPRMDQSL